jgi:hypothetical protein
VSTEAQVSYRDEVWVDAPAGFWRLGEQAGTVAADETPNASQGSYQGGVTLGLAGALASDPDSAAGFDGANDLVTMGDPASGVLDVGTGDFTVELWLKTAVHGERLLVAKRASGRYWQLTVTDDPGEVGRVRVQVYDGSVSRQAYSSVRVDDGVWHHLVVRFDRDSGISFYVDGVASGSTAATSTGSVSNSGSFQLAKISGYSYFGGDLDEVALYRGLLPAARIQAHVAAR